MLILCCVSNVFKLQPRLLTSAGLLMGNCNCFMKKSRDPNQLQSEPALPPTGYTNRTSRSKKTSATSVQQQSLSGSSKAKPGKNEESQRASAILVRKRHVSSGSRIENIRKGKKHGSPTNHRKMKQVGWVSARSMHSFCYSVLRTATQKFSKNNIIGEGGFGYVYVGYINPDNMNAAKPNTGKAVAIKKLKMRGVEADEQYKTELRFLNTLNHPNVVKLMGYCHDRNHNILVYEHMAKGSLDAHLLDENDRELNWCRRIKIAVGAARAVEYLHSRARPIIHRDLKASNVLLDADFNPKISDFGLARFGPLDDLSHVSTRVLGTRGYFAPEYLTTGHLTVKTDIYSFGVVLLEILSGCVAIKNYTDGTTGDLAIWAKSRLSNQMELHNIIDKKIARNIDMEEAQKFASIIGQCLSSDPKDRPTMEEVVANLEQIQQNMLLTNFNSLGLAKYHRSSRAHI